MKILVTGATGYLGRRLVPFLTERGEAVRVLARPTSDVAFLEALPGVEIVHGDITDAASLKGLDRGIDRAFHLAVLGHLSSDQDPDIFEAVNVQGSLNVLRQLTGPDVRKVVFTTTTAALGLIRKKTVTEEDFAAPATPYGLSKHKAEETLAAFCKERRVPCVYARLSHIYGPGEKRDLFKIIRLMKKGIFPQVGFAPNLYPAVYIDDAVQGIWLTMEKGRPGQTYTITDVDSHDLRDVRRIVRACFGKRAGPYPIVPKQFMLLSFSLLDAVARLCGKALPVSRKNIEFIAAGRRFSIEKARQTLGYEPAVPLEEGLKRTIESYREESLL